MLKLRIFLFLLLSLGIFSCYIVPEIEKSYIDNFTEAYACLNNAIDYPLCLNCADGLELIDGICSIAQGDDSDGGDGSPENLLNECQDPETAWVFCSGFEEGNKDIWDDYDNNEDSTNLLMEDSGPFNLSGNHVMRLRVPPGRGGADLVKVLPASYDRLFARWYIQWEPGYDFNAANHGGGLFAGARNLLGRSDYRPQGDDWFTAWIEPIPDNHKLNIYSYYRGMYMDCADPNGSCWGDHFPCMYGSDSSYCGRPEHRPSIDPPVMESGRWYCIEMMIDAGTPVNSADNANGIMSFWVDGVEIGPWNNLWFRTTSNLKLNILWLNLFHHAEHSVEGVFYDNVVVSTERVFCR